MNRREYLGWRDVRKVQTIKHRECGTTVADIVVPAFSWPFTGERCGCKGGMKPEHETPQGWRMHKMSPLCIEPLLRVVWDPDPIPFGDRFGLSCPKCDPAGDDTLSVTWDDITTAFRKGKNLRI